ncbi:MAG TPA: hypothetical protein VIJ16_07445 [Gemmatimonadaceae bacterium]
MELDDARQLDVPAQTSVRDAWSTVTQKCRVSDAELAKHVAQRFRLAWPA